MIKEYYLSILSGQQRGFVAAIIKSTLTTFTLPYSAVLKTRNALYNNGIVRSTSLPAKVISIGNITTGGTGKTPLVEFSVKYLREIGKKVAILSRGYGGNNSSQEDNEITNDECLALKENLQDVPVLAGKDRVKNGEKAISEFGVDCVILDDGFQHFKLKRDLDIVVIDALNPFGGGKLIPRGGLREPLRNLGRADLFIISHCDQGKEQTIQSIYTRLKQINPRASVCESNHTAVQIDNIKDGTVLELEWLKGKRVYALSGIGNPESFTFTLKGLEADLIMHRVFRDHHNYTQSELDKVISDSQLLGADAIVVTQKDIVKIRKLEVKGANILSLKIEIQITKGIELYKEAIDRVVKN
ncbi:tetraacyldisaccharide 4'-kinase [Candidatus Scalindua japonica]|uniref:Tetraacyldisaccharide 4'-kinase n=1 Tax=Candidatus Scalindua japonica TaxID=1284222 RepID=A0A286TV03_9BACT|nr:tetraacyldisaccharide 4'-kinase [Candidatus Scalindua japonica]GAX59708.1 tetraacyldisaccharide 4'-kinase [Candidatus Scalindua japonica]